jgi:hypothetical protein
MLQIRLAPCAANATKNDFPTTSPDGALRTLMGAGLRDSRAAKSDVLNVIWGTERSNCRRDQKQEGSLKTKEG